MNGKACEAVIDGGVVSKQHFVEIVQKSSKPKATLHGRIAVFDRVDCKASPITRGKRSFSQLTPATTDRDDTNRPQAPALSMAGASSGSVTDVGALIQQTLETWTKIVDLLFGAMGCNPPAAPTKEKNAEFVPLSAMSALQIELTKENHQTTMVDKLIHRYGFADQLQKKQEEEEQMPITKHCQQLRANHFAMVSLIHTSHSSSASAKSTTNLIDQSLNEGHLAVFLEEKVFAFNPADHLERVKKILLLLADTQELLKLIGVRVEGYEAGGD
eukprot:c7357_g1_i1.p1 GENE.c7357_g1_i1~~c7357_g1_i1.p1  ORF type:complete len:272 (-),score=95.26 c7357_g1_i1:35-850(-)